MRISLQTINPTTTDNLLSAVVVTDIANSKGRGGSRGGLGGLQVILSSLTHLHMRPTIAWLVAVWLVADGCTMNIH